MSPRSLFFGSSTPSRKVRGPRRRFLTLAHWHLSLIPVDGDYGRLRPDARPRAPTDEAARTPAHGKERDSRSRRRSELPPLPTHARNAVEEWIPIDLLYGPPG